MTYTELIFIFIGYQLGRIFYYLAIEVIDGFRYRKATQSPEGYTNHLTTNELIAKYAIAGGVNSAAWGTPGNPPHRLGSTENLGSQKEDAAKPHPGLLERTTEPPLNIPPTER